MSSDNQFLKNEENEMKIKYIKKELEYIGKKLF